MEMRTAETEHGEQKRVLEWNANSEQEQWSRAWNRGALEWNANSENRNVETEMLGFEQ
jgi:hypothetical protein